jgi:peptidyl-prolyl cis-trans isomerase A (cyclophilin A)
MPYKHPVKSLFTVSLLSVLAWPSYATIVEFVTSQGKIEVNLFDNATPKTVANFLTYVEADSYNTTVIHRSISNFIVQGGGFKFDGSKLVKATANAAVVNEPLYSNIKGTISMAKLSSGPNSATNQWFFNVNDNSANLDYQNAGFTVFGQVVSGMDVLIKIQNLTHCGETPFDNYTATQCTDGSSVPGFENYVSITNVEITDPTVDTANGLSPAKIKPPSDKSSSGGALGILSIFAGVMMIVRRRKFK